MKVKKSFYTTMLFMAILVVGVLVLFFMTKNIFNNSDTVDKPSSTTERSYNA